MACAGTQLSGPMSNRFCRPTHSTGLTFTMASTTLIDLRSDTVTKPSAAMRKAMAEAEVGDDVLDGDPTMRRLEQKVAAMLGHEAALWVPTGCMGNIIALMLHLSRGDKFLAPAQAHVLGSELGTAAWLAGGMPVAIPWSTPGKITPEQVRAAAAEGGAYYNLRTTLLCIENTHNFAGGTVYTVEEFEALLKTARELGLKVHVDGARLWHAAVALGVDPRQLARGADSVNVCLSKGLGAPVGSVLCGSADFIAHARRLRKALGGGVRQGGVLAAAGLVALERIPHLAADHAKAARLAAAARSVGAAVAAPPTNIVLVPVSDTAAAAAALKAEGVWVSTVGPALRLIAHSDVSEEDIDRACAVLKRVLPRFVGPRAAL